MKNDRAEYQQSELDVIEGVSHFTLLNRYKTKVQCTIYPCVNNVSNTIIVYAHGANGCRLDGLFDTLQFAQASNVALCLFDFTGCGMSDGVYSTFGLLYERYDVDCVVRHCVEQLGYEQVLLWGRSIGAVASILYASENPERVAGLILDSPYHNLIEVLQYNVRTRAESIEQMIGTTVVDKKLIQLLRKEVMKVFPELDIAVNIVEKAAEHCTIPALFLHGELDTVIPPEQSLQLFNRFGSSSRRYRTFAGGHNSTRTADFFDPVAEFLNSLFAQETAARRFNSCDGFTFTCKPYVWDEYKVDPASPRSADVSLKTRMVLSPFSVIMQVRTQCVNLVEPFTGTRLYSYPLYSFNSFEAVDDSIIRFSIENESNSHVLWCNGNSMEIVAKVLEAKSTLEQTRFDKLTPVEIDDNLLAFMRELRMDCNFDPQSLKTGLVKMLKTRFDIDRSSEEMSEWFDGLLLRMYQEETV